jgi:hypothetical protein
MIFCFFFQCNQYHCQEININAIILIAYSIHCLIAVAVVFFPQEKEASWQSRQERAMDQSLGVKRVKPGTEAPGQSFLILLHSWQAETTVTRICWQEPKGACYILCTSPEVPPPHRSGVEALLAALLFFTGPFSGFLLLPCF